MRASETIRTLGPTATLDFDHPHVAAFATRHAAGSPSPRERAVRLYYAVRDGIRYDPYQIDLSVEGLRASHTLATGRGWCVSKAILLAAACRAQGVPSRLGFADVRNHLSTARLRERMGTDVFHWHGFTAVLLGDRWIKATPAFNAELCQRFGLEPLEFDGREDSLLHPFDRAGRRHMEYLADRGEFDDVPIAAIRKTFERAYRPILAGLEADFERDVDEETGGRGSRRSSGR